MDPGDKFIAIVEDDARIRTALLRLFRFAHYRAQAFCSADALLGSLSKRMPSCVVLDLHLPGMSGLELLRRLAKLDPFPPVVVITAHDDERVETACRALGSKRYFRKPIDCDKLLDAVHELVAA